MEFNSTFVWDGTTKQRINAAVRSAQMKVDSTVLQYVKKYSRRLSGTLMKSATLHTIIGSGLIIQKTPYARKVYYTGVPSLAHNRDAQLRWFDVIKSRHKAEMIRFAQAKLAEVNR
jgi:hypothetical protein